MWLIWILLFTPAVSEAITIGRTTFCSSAETSRNYRSKTNFRVEGLTPHPSLISTVSYLIDQYQVPGPLVLHFTNEVGPRKVWSSETNGEKHLYFAKNAVDLLLGIEIEKVAKEVCAPGWSGEKTFEVVYTNTVLEQFLRNANTREGLERYIRNKTGWVLRGKPGDSHYDQEQDFRKEELVTLIKQIVDLPPEVISNFKLRRLCRYRMGARLPVASAKALYFRGEQLLLIGDEALMDDGIDLYGEGTVLHEFGHSYWYGISPSTRDSFVEISWRKKGSQWELKKQGSEGFISDYAMTKPEEDFAEHFSGFVHQPEYLKRTAPAKDSFFKREVFKDTSYFSTVAPNAKVHVASANPDTKNPWLDRSYAESYSASKRVLDPGTGATEVSVTVKGARDDLSGIAKILFTLEHEKNPEYRVFVDLFPETAPDGSTTLKGVVVTDPRKIAKGLYRPTTLGLRDLAGNREYYKGGGLPGLELSGDLSAEALVKENVDFGKIHIESAPPIQGYPGVRVTLPYFFREGVDSIHTTWEFPDLEGKTTHVCSFRDRVRSNEVPCVSDATPGKPIQLLLYFHKQYPSSTIRLASFLIRFAGTGGFGKSDLSYAIPVGTLQAVSRIDTRETRLRQMDLGVNGMTLRSVSAPNKEGGDQNIEFKIPLLNRSAGEFYIYATVRSPTGARISRVISETNLKPDYVIQREGSQEFLVFNMELKKNPENGEYLVEGFELKTKYENEQPRNPRLPLDLNELSTQKIKLLERGIRKSFTIKDEKIQRIQ